MPIAARQTRRPRRFSTEPMHARPSLDPALSLSGYYFVYFAFIGVFSPYFGLYLQSLSFSAWDIGLLMSQMQLMRLLGPYVWGWLSDRRGDRLGIIRLAAAASLAGFTVFFWTHHLGWMMLAMAVLAFFWSAALPLVEALTFDHLRQQPERYSRIRLWGSVGFIVAVTATGYGLDHLPLTAVVWICWAVLLGILLFSLSLPEARLEGPRPEAPPMGEILAQPKVRALLLACFFMSAAHGALYVFYSIHAAQEGYSKGEVGLLWALGVVAEIAMFMAMPRILASLQLRWILFACFAAAALRFWLMGWWLSWVSVAIFCQLLHALTFGAYHVAAIASINRWFVGRAQARGQALYSSLSFGAGGLLGGLLSGWMWDRWGAGWTYSLSAGFACVGGALIWLGLRGEETDA